MDTSRQRILYFIDVQKIRPVDFLNKTGLRKGFVDKAHQKSGITDNYLSIILDCYPELSAEWLLTGKGTMLRTNINSNLNDVKTVFNEHLKPVEKVVLEDKQKIITVLEKNNEDLRITIKNLVETISIQKELIMNLKNKNTD